MIERMDDELPRDPDHDNAPELEAAAGRLHISGIDRKTGEPFDGLVTREHVAAAVADRRRRDEPDP